MHQSAERCHPAPHAASIAASGSSNSMPLTVFASDGGECGEYVRLHARHSLQPDMLRVLPHVLQDAILYLG